VRESQEDSPYIHLGCWEDSLPRALLSFEGTSPTLDGNYKNRERAFQKCFELTKSLGYKIFGVQDGGQCFISTLTLSDESYKTYGPSNECLSDGEGGPMANDVYKVKE